MSTRIQRRQQHTLSFKPVWLCVWHLLSPSNPPDHITRSTQTHADGCRWPTNKDVGRRWRPSRAAISRPASRRVWQEKIHFRRLFVVFLKVCDEDQTRFEKTTDRRGGETACQASCLYWHQNNHRYRRSCDFYYQLIPHWLISWSVKHQILQVFPLRCSHSTHIKATIHPTYNKWFIHSFIVISSSSLLSILFILYPAVTLLINNGLFYLILY